MTKSNQIAGPKAMMHMVDVVLRLEEDMSQAFRMLRADKNRNGSTNEVRALLAHVQHHCACLCTGGARMPGPLHGEGQQGWEEQRTPSQQHAPMCSDIPVLCTGLDRHACGKGHIR